MRGELLGDTRARTIVREALPGPAVRTEVSRAADSASSRGLKATVSDARAEREATGEDARTARRVRRGPDRRPVVPRAARQADGRGLVRDSGDRPAVRTDRLGTIPARGAGRDFQDRAREPRPLQALVAATGEGAFPHGTEEGPGALMRRLPRPLRPRRATAGLLTVRGVHRERSAAVDGEAGTATLAETGRTKTGAKTGENFSRRARAAAAARTTALRCALQRGRARSRWTAR